MNLSNGNFEKKFPTFHLKNPLNYFLIKMNLLYFLCNYPKRYRIQNLLYMVKTQSKLTGNF